MKGLYSLRPILKVLAHNSVFCVAFLSFYRTSNIFDSCLVSQFPFYAGGTHNLDLNLGISPPSFGNGQKETEGRIQFHPGPYDVHSRKLSGVMDFRFLVCFKKKTNPVPDA